MRRQFAQVWVGVVIVTLFLNSFATGWVTAQANAPLKEITDQDAKFLTDWVDLVYSNVKADSIDAPSAARIYSYLGVTLYESVVGGLPGYRPVGELLKDFPMPPTLSVEVDWQTVTAATTARVSDYLLPSEKSKASTAKLLAAQLSARKKAVTESFIEPSIKYGELLADGIIAYAKRDGGDEARVKPYTLPSGEPYLYVSTSPGAKAVGAYWGTLNAWGLTDNTECNEPITYTFSSEKGSTFYKYAEEVMNIGSKLTQDQKDTVNFWIDTPGETGAPAGHWVSIANQLVSQFDLKVGKAAETLAMVGMALGDSFISCWNLKFETNLLRPETYINRYIRRGWRSFVITPPFPSYNSGHATSSAAAAEVLTELFGSVFFTDSTHLKRNPEIKLAPRTYSSFYQAADEAALSRLYGGIHYRFDNESGLRQGRCVGRKLIERVKLKK